MRFADQLRLGVTLLLILLAAHAAAVFTWQVVGPGEMVRTRPEIGAPAGLAKAKARHEKTVAAKPPGLLLFGKATREPVAKLAKPAPTDKAPKTTLNLVLKGVIAIKPLERALAIISEKGKRAEENVYGIGDKVPGNAVVQAIYEDRVILSRAGKYETLLMSEEQNGGLSRMKQRGNGRSSRASGVTSLGDDINWQISKSYWDEKISDIPSLAREVGVEIFKEGGVQKGFKIVSSKGSQLLTEIGLKPGDVLYEVNGIKLVNAAQGLTAFKRIKNASQINMVVGRNGERVSRSYRIDKSQ